MVAVAFEVGDDVGGGVDVFFHGVFDFGGDAVCVAQENAGREGEVQFDEIGVADVAVAQVVVADAMARGLGGDDVFDGAVCLRIGGVHQPADAAPDETEARDEDVERGSDGEERREFIYVDDVVELTRRLTLGVQTGLVNIASGTSYTFAQALRSVEDLIARRAAVNSRPRSQDKVDHHFDKGKLREWFPDFRFTDLNTGLLRTKLAEETLPS